MPSPPTTEIGRVHGVVDIPGWGAFGTTLHDDREHTREVTWPRSVQTYERMETDAQQRGLLLGTTLCIRRFRWMVDPNGARDEVAEHIATDFNLPIKGADPEPGDPRGHRFDHDTHLAHALRALVYGHYPFEQLVQVGDDGKVHLRKLAPRPPYTIANGGSIDVERDGGLKGIKQGGMSSPLIPVNRLLFYSWEREGGNWFGRSMLRSTYKNWAIKDRLIRLDGLRHERNSMGVPWFETPQDLPQDVVDALAQAATEIRAGERSGGAGPGKLAIKGVEGALPDILASIRYHDEQSSVAWLAMFAELGRAESGSYALGQTLFDFYRYAQEAIADWYAGTTTAHGIADIVDWSYGIDEGCPKLVYERSSEEELPVADLVALIDAGAIIVDSELEAALRQRHKLPARADEEAQEAPPVSEPAAQITTARGRLKGKILTAAASPRPWPALATAAGRRSTDGTARRARDELLSEGKLTRREDGSLVATASTGSTGSFRREPTAIETAAAVDFTAMDATWSDARDSLVAAVKDAQAAQLDQLTAQIEAAGGLTDLASVRAEPIDPQVIAEAMRAAAAEGMAQVGREMSAQGATPTVRTAADSEEELEGNLDEHAAALSVVLAGAYSEAASRKAVALGGGGLTMAEVASAVREHMSGLSDAFLEEQLGGAIQGASNAGRFTAMGANPARRYFASELLDASTCPPCADIDGEEFDSLDDLEANYPGLGGYALCEGGPRCRGTGIAIWTDEPVEPAPAPVAQPVPAG